MKIAVFTIALLAISYSISGQTLKQNMNIDRQMAGSNAAFIKHFPVQKEPIKGDVYLFDQMLDVELILNNKEVHQLKANYNLLDNKLEVNYEDQIRAIPVQFIEQVKVLAAKYVSGEHYTYQGNPINKLVKVLKEGEELILLEMIDLEFIKANYNVQLDAGYNYDRYVKKPVVLMGEKDESLHEVKGGKNKIFKLFEEQQESIKQYAKEHNLNPKQTEDLAKLIEFADQI